MDGGTLFNREIALSRPDLSVFRLKIEHEATVLLPEGLGLLGLFTKVRRALVSFFI